MQLTTPQQNTIRTQPQRSGLYLSIFEPRTIFQAQVNSASVGKGSRVIPFDNVTLGSIADIEANFTLLVGTIPGARDVGKIRIRSVTATEFTISENSNITWANDLYLTVLRFVELWPIYPRIIQDPADAENVIFYKDYDIVYSNQNSILGTFPNAGPHRGLFKGEQVYYSSTGTSNLVGSGLTYDWSFEGGTPTGSTSKDPGNVTYPTTGDYVTRLIITAANGATDTTYRYVSVYDRPGEGSDTPISKWELTNLGGSRDEGGYKAAFRVHENITITENAVVVLFGEDWYGATKQSFGGNHPNSEKIFFVGYVLDGSIRYDWQHSFVEFQVGSITEMMKESLGFAISVESKAAPAFWFELLDMDGRRGMYHYLKWHTTALQISDFQFLGNDQKIQFFDTDRTSMYDALDNYMRNTLIGKVVSDRQSKVWMEQDAKSYPNPTGSFTSTMDITRRDWMGEPSIDERPSNRLSYLEYGGIAYSGASTGTFTAHLACAPGAAPSFRGRIDTPHGLAIAGQSQLNQMVGNVWENENSKYPRIGLDMAFNAKNFDIAPQETVQMDILANDTVRGVRINGLYIPNGINWRYDPKNQRLLTNVDFVNLANGAVGETIGIPLSVPDAGFETGWSVPGLQIPPLPILTIPPLFGSLLTGTSGGGSQEVLASADYGRAMFFAGSGWFTSVRGVTLVNNTITSSKFIDIEFTAVDGGIYFAMGGHTAVKVNTSTQATDKAQLLLNGSSYYNAEHWAEGVNTNTTNFSMSAGGIVVAGNGASIKYVNGPNIGVDSVKYAWLSLIRIST